MTTAIAPVSSDIISQIVLKGDLSSLNPAQKVEYYRNFCERVGLDPLTQPFQLLKLNGKEVLYASKSATEQLSRLHGVSHDIRDRQMYEGVFAVYVRATDVKTGRYTDSSGVVNTSGLKGDNLANALMKAETKAKRRATLALLGLGMLDETEIETIPGAERAELPPAARVEQSEMKHESGQPEPSKPVEPTEEQKMRKGLLDILSVTIKGHTPEEKAAAETFVSDCKEFIKRRYGKKARTELSNEEIKDFTKFIGGLASGTLMPFDYEPFSEEKKAEATA